MGGIDAHRRVKSFLIVSEEQHRAHKFLATEIERIDEMRDHAEGDQISKNQWQDAKRPADIERLHVDRSIPLLLHQEPPGDDIAAEHEEDVHAKQSALRPKLTRSLRIQIRVIRHYQDDGQAPESIDRADAVDDWNLL